MNVVWGLAIVVVGVLLVASARAESQFVAYRLLVARSKILWGEKVYRFHQAAGALLVVFGSLVALGVIR